MTKSYLITLKPTGKFFFGGDMTFKVNNNETEYSSYIIKSKRFPQQTSLLGMLRFLLLNNSTGDVFADGKIKDSSMAANLIGRESFGVNEKHEERSYGKIVRLSPCFLVDGEKPIIQVSRIADEPLSLNFSETAFVNGHKVVIPNFKYDSKKGLADIYDFSKIYLEDVRIGIKKRYDGKVMKEHRNDGNDDALFKQISYCFKNNDGVEAHSYAFAFYAEVDDTVNLKVYDKQLVSLGADSSMFTISVKEECYVEHTIKHNVDKSVFGVVLASPTYIEKKYLDEVSYAISDLVPFRFMSTTVETKSYNKLSGEIKHSEKYNLYDMGSLFFFKSSEERDNFLSHVDSYKEFKQIGYNHYSKIN